MSQLQHLAFLFLFFAITVAGIVEAIRIDHVGLLGLFAGLLLLGGAFAVRVSRMRRAFVLRSDIAHWIDGVSAVTGEPPETLVNRALSAYRAGMSDERHG